MYFESAEEARTAGYTHSMDYHRLAARDVKRSPVVLSRSAH